MMKVLFLSSIQRQVVTFNQGAITGRAVSIEALPLSCHCFYTDCRSYSPRFKAKRVATLTVLLKSACLEEKTNLLL